MIARIARSSREKKKKPARTMQSKLQYFFHSFYISNIEREKKLWLGWALVGSYSFWVSEWVSLVVILFVVVHSLFIFQLSMEFRVVINDRKRLEYFNWRIMENEHNAKQTRNIEFEKKMKPTNERHWDSLFNIIIRRFRVKLKM